MRSGAPSRSTSTAATPWTSPCRTPAGSHVACVSSAWSPTFTAVKWTPASPTPGSGRARVQEELHLAHPGQREVVHAGGARRRAEPQRVHAIRDPDAREHDLDRPAGAVPPAAARRVERLHRAGGPAARSHRRDDDVRGARKQPGGCDGRGAAQELPSDDAERARRLAPGHRHAVPVGEHEVGA